MVGKIIRDYMEGGNKKLTVPGFGTFMRKDTGEILFVDLIRKDDGMLRQLVEDYGHYSDVEAMALIDRFIFETKHGIEKHGEAYIDCFGTILIDSRGTYQFHYSPKAKPEKETPVQERLFPKEADRPAAATAASHTQRTTAQPSRRPAAAKTQPKRNTKGKKTKPDTLILIAIIAAAIAIVIMIFSLSVGGSLPFLNK